MANHLLRGTHPGAPPASPAKPVYRCWLYRGTDKHLFEGHDAVRAAMDDGWVDCPMKAVAKAAAELEQQSADAAELGESGLPVDSDGWVQVPEDESTPAEPEDMPAEPEDDLEDEGAKPSAPASKTTSKKKTATKKKAASRK